ncbi:Ankyrin repeat, SAM and basic leucine zipper domain-containing protein 1 [Portunus trituberculatus]|uniref:Ankyrin repeat, SAM and basic leucine zipper domain-containing protein 1 n=1 Tax=Portunus trituberculatus TaxID=210409 RepID=A0A5B7DNC7_PORTR|nr:Ankyrin repeat, SAM and basic leucine zipper domain-containing protein 1 [Portunus trituberculatus]
MLHKAVYYNYPGIVDLALGAGAKVDTQSKNGKTALHWAARSQGVEVVQALLKTCPDAKLEDRDGRTPLDIAKRHNKKVVKIIQGEVPGCSTPPTRTTLRDEACLSRHPAASPPCLTCQGREQSVCPVHRIPLVFHPRQRLMTYRGV